jgi:hypothetical protein
MCECSRQIANASTLLHPRDGVGDPTVDDAGGDRARVRHEVQRRHAESGAAGEDGDVAAQLRLDQQ